MEIKWKPRFGKIFSDDDVIYPRSRFQPLVKRSILGVWKSIMILGLLFSSSTWAEENYSRFRIPLIKYAGGNFNSRPEAVESLLAQVAKRTSVEVKRGSLTLELTDPKLYQYPMVYMSGDAAFEPFSEEVLRILRTYLGGYFYDEYGSFDYAWYLSIALSFFATVVHLPINERPLPRLATT
mgnify:CR=1 FL=1